jgi:hypothetical protein
MVPESLPETHEPIIRLTTRSNSQSVIFFGAGQEE